MKGEPTVGSPLKCRVFLSDHIPTDRHGCAVPVLDLHVTTQCQQMQQHNVYIYNNTMSADVTMLCLQMQQRDVCRCDKAMSEDVTM
jgi:hypothetical protein